MKKTILFSAILFITNSVIAQDKKQTKAIRIAQPPKIDGILDESIWNDVPVATDFIQLNPNPGASSAQKTEVKVIYDDVAFYIGAMMYDTEPDSILHELSQRDNEANAELFGFMVDTYNDDINAFGFFVTSAGVQIDAKYERQDFNWNAVWESSVKINDKGWIAEFKIPYSAIRFSKAIEQNWGINFLRKIRRCREMSFWNKVDPVVNGMIRQSGDIAGINNITSPVRLSATPYVSAYVENYPYDQKDNSNNSYSLNGGMDMKYGISKSFTLDMTLVPDFSQVQSDNKVLNLTPYEIKYNERRPFFTEGTELFNKSGLFYSRRVGGQPMGYYDVYNNLTSGETVANNPAAAQLINAVKISGRTKDNLGIGFFNAITANTYATVTDSLGNQRKIMTQPLANYNITVFDQVLKNNSYVSLINTNVTRNGNAYDANVTSGEFKLTNKKNIYSVSGGGSMSQKFYSDSSGIKRGYESFYSANKISGNLVYGIYGELLSDTYDKNDLGYLSHNNYVFNKGYMSYNIYKPFWKLNGISSTFETGYWKLYNPNSFVSCYFYGQVGATFSKQYFYTLMSLVCQPLKGFDYYEPRVKGRYYVTPVYIQPGYYFSSDYRKRFALDGSINYTFYNDSKRFALSFGLSPRFRVSDKLMFIYEFYQGISKNDIGFADVTNDIVTFGKRDLLTISNSLSTNYIFTNKMSLSFRLRHYWSKAEYKKYYTLNDVGELFDSDYSGDKDVNFNAFNIDMIYTWQFAPGSEMSVVWKNAIINQKSPLINRYFDNLNKTIDSPQTNSFSIKLLYYLDYLYLKKVK